MIYVHWERPRLWAVRLYQPSGKGGSYVGRHISVGVIAESVDRAIDGAQKLHPEARIESVNDKGAVDLVVDVPQVDVLAAKESGR